MIRQIKYNRLAAPFINILNGLSYQELDDYSLYYYNGSPFRLIEINHTSKTIRIKHERIISNNIDFGLDKEQINEIVKDYYKIDYNVLSR